MKDPSTVKDYQFATTLEGLYAHLNPSGVDSQLILQKSVDTRSISQIIKEVILGSSGDVYSWQSLKNDVEKYFKAPSRNSEAVKNEKDELAQRFHAISSDDNGILDLGDSSYWGKNTKRLNSFVPSLDKSLKNNKKCVVSAYVSRDPYISPATRGASDVEIFLNYMPSHAVAQMVPFLDVEFELLGQVNSSFITTPSYMRFLLGSVDTKGLNQFDKALVDADIIDKQTVETSRRGKKVKQGSRNTIRSGVESFLMPQTLTNMDNLAPGSNRLVRAKPFLPLASIEGFDVSVMNAGAGSYVHKTANLKLKVHDKSRIGEFSEFIRGPSGYASAVIWTKYGWSAPVGRTEDAYSNFINEKMRIEDCWAVKDAQFSFDAGGQVTLTLQLVTKGIRDMQKVMVSAGEGTLADQQNKLRKSIDTILYYYNLLKRDQSFSVDVTMTEVLNSASTTGNIGDYKNVEQITKKIQAISERSGLSSSAAQELKVELDRLTGANKQANVYMNYVNSIPEAVAKKFNSLSVGIDPFLPRRSNTKEEQTGGKDEEKLKEYFPSDDLIEAIDVFRKDWDKRNANIKAAIIEQNKSNNKDKEANGVTKPIDLEEKVNVVSFGKLFMNFAASALVSIEDVDELQVFFYPMNDFSGPMSGYSIAEFPIDTTVLAYSYAEEIKRLNTNELTLQQFLKLVIDSQFADVRAVGYGRNSYYKPFAAQKGKAEKLDDSEIESKDAKWTARYGGWRPPIIDFYLEVGEYKDEEGRKSFKVRKHRNDSENVTKSGTLIKRLHVFDKQLNPYRLAQSILSGDSGYERGDVNRGKIQGAASPLVKELQKDKKKFLELVEKINKMFLEVDEAERDGLETATTEQERRTIRQKADQKRLSELQRSAKNIPTEAEVVDRPGRRDYKIKLDGNKREVVKSELMKFVPTVVPGSNGSLVQAINVGSKTDGTMGAANLYRVVKGGTGKNALSANGLEEINELPLRTVPIQLTMTTSGCPTASLYQSYFFDLNTGTTIDNLYTCTQMQHQMSAGKFTTNWTFAFADGYGKFGSPPTVAGLITKVIQGILNTAAQESAPKPKSPAAQTAPTSAAPPTTASSQPAAPKPAGTFTRLLNAPLTQQ
jgi:hypothetical protein